MELISDKEYEQILLLVKQLPRAKIIQLKIELDKELIEKKSKREISDLQKLLLNGPVMSNKQYEQFKESRKKWG